MDKFDIEAYLDGRLSEEDRVKFEQELKNNASLAKDVSIQKLLRTDLQQLSLRERIKAALNTDESQNDLPKQGYIKWIVIGLLLAVLTYVGFHMVSSQSKNEDNNPTLQEPTTQETLGPITQDSTLLNPIDIKKEVQQPGNHNKEIESNNPKAESRVIYAQDVKQNQIKTNPYGELRGSESEKSDKSKIIEDNWKSLPIPNHLFSEKTTKVLELLNDKTPEKAYVRLQILERSYPKNDTIKWIKCFTLLELREGGEVLSILQNLDPTEIKLTNHKKWYKAMSYFLVNDIENAKIELEELSSMNPTFNNDQMKIWKDILIRY